MYCGYESEEDYIEHRDAYDDTLEQELSKLLDEEVSYDE